MSNTIKLKRGSGSNPSASDLEVGELAIRTDSGKIFTKKDNGSVAEISGGGGGIDDGDKGDITVSNGGDTFTIDDGVVTEAKIADDAITNDKISNVSNFTFQDVTCRYVYGKRVSLTDVAPELKFLEQNSSPDYKIKLDSGILDFYDITNTTSRMSIQSDGHIDIAGNLDVGAGIDVTGHATVSQSLTVTGTTSLGETVNITGNDPNITFVDSNNNPDFRIFGNGGTLNFVDSTSSANRLVINSDGHVDVTGNLDVGAGIDVTGDITGTGELKLTSTDAGSSSYQSSAPKIDLYRNSASPANDDYLGQIQFTGREDNSTDSLYAAITGKIGKPNAGIQDGEIEFMVANGGSNKLAARLDKNDLHLLNDTGIDVTGESTINAALILGGSSVSGAEGGELRLTQAPNGSLAGDTVKIDIYNNKLRFFESGSPNKGFYLPLDEGGNSVDGQIWTSTTDGSGSGLDADTLDGVQGSSYLRSDTNDTFSGNLTVNGIIYLQDQIRIGDDVFIEDYNVANAFRVKGNQDSNKGFIAFGQQTKKLGVDGASAALTYDGNTVIDSAYTGALANGVTATTQSAGDSSTKIATTAYTDTAISNLINGAPSALDTLNELAAAMSDDAAFSTTVTNSLATKMPLAGGQFTGNITFSGSQTVDGRDLSVDGAKLDGIESGATADQSNSEIKTAYEANSDTNAFTDALLSKLNGIAASATNVTNNNQLTNGAGYITATLTQEQVEDFVGGMLTGNTESGITVTYQDSDGTIDFSVASQTDNNFTNADHSKLDGIESGATADQTASEILTLIKTVDGSGSGLDADTLDGISSASFLRSDADDTFAGNLTVDGTGSVEDVFKISDEAGNQRLLMGNRDSAGVNCPKIFNVGNASLTIGIGDSWSGDGGTLTNQFNIAKNGTITSYGNHDFNAGIDVTGNITVSGTVDGRDVASDGSKLDGIESGATADQSANEILTLIKTVDGSGSGLDADTLDGANASVDAGNNTIVRRHSSGYIFANYINTTDNSVSSSVSGIICKQGDSYHRTATAAAVRSFLNVADGANNITNNNQLTNGAGYVTTNTTYSAYSGYGLFLSGTQFGLANDRRRNANEDVQTGNNSDQIFFDTDVGIRFYTNGAEDMRLTDGGVLHVDDDVVAYSTTISDIRLKKDIELINNPLDIINAINGYTFTFKKDNKKSAGVVAQEVEKVFPQAVKDQELPYVSEDIENPDVFKTVEYDQIVGLLVQAVKELSGKIKKLEGK